jgi:hypothetical protein
LPVGSQVWFEPSGHACGVGGAASAVPASMAGPASASAQGVPSLFVMPLSWPVENMFVMSFSVQFSCARPVVASEVMFGTWTRNCGWLVRGSIIASGLPSSAPGKKSPPEKNFVRSFQLFVVSVPPRDAGISVGVWQSMQRLALPAR